MKKSESTKQKTNVESTTGFFHKISKNSSPWFLSKTKKPKAALSLGSTENPFTSYNMTGCDSDDHKLEIGVPILISKTTFDAEGISSACNISSQCSSYSIDSRSSTNTSVVGTNTLYNSTNHKTNGAEDKKLSLKNDLQSKILKHSRSESTLNLDKTRVEHASSTGNSILHWDEIRSTNGVLPAAFNVDQHRRSATGNSCTSDYENLGSFASFEGLIDHNNSLCLRELNDITRQINESFEFKSSIETRFECCQDDGPTVHPPSKLHWGKKLPQFVGSKKDKLSYAWDGIKSWIYEGRVKVKEAVNKRSITQRSNAEIFKPFESNSHGNGKMCALCQCSDKDMCDHNHPKVIAASYDGNVTVSDAFSNAERITVQDCSFEVKFK